MQPLDRHTHRLIMYQPGVFLCVHCGHVFASPAAAETPIAKGAKTAPSHSPGG